MSIIQEELKKYIKDISCGVVDEPSSVEVKAVQGEQTLVLEIYVPKEERGKLIGKRGKNANAMRTLLCAASTRLGIRCVMEIVE